MALEQDLVDLLVCPESRGQLVYFPDGLDGGDDGFLLCPTSRLKYRVERDIPVMLIEEAERLDEGAVAGLLQKAKQLGLATPSEA